MKDYKIYSMKDLKEKELTETDLYYLFDTPSLNYSLVVNMFRFMGFRRSVESILNECSTDDRWVYKYSWTKKHHDDWIKEVAAVFRNVNQTGEEESLHAAEWWVFQYGLTVPGENLLDE